MIDYEEKYKNFVYIDEAGRGCIGGEMVFTGVKVTGDVSCADDSKKLSHKQREEMVDKIKRNIQHCTVITSAIDIDKNGLAPSIKKSLETIIEYFGDDEHYLYDGSSVFNCNHPNLHTLVKADALVKGVGAASIIAKHTKDTLMLEHHKTYPDYGFKDNAGYGTKKHIEAIKEHGFTPLHRKSYKVKALEEWKNNQAAGVLF